MALAIARRIVVIKTVRVENNDTPLVRRRRAVIVLTHSSASDKINELVSIRDFKIRGRDAGKSKSQISSGRSAGRLVKAE